ncbi:MAG: 30S ribosomal protein S7 [Pseudomonadota bacterium]
MSRRKGAIRRDILPDPKYNDKMVARLINKVIMRGKKSLAERIVYSAFDIIESRTKQEPLSLFKASLDNIKPVIEVKSRRVGGATYQVPLEIRSDRRVSLALKWLITHARQRPEKSMPERLAGEMLDAANNRGNAFKKKEDTHKMAEANKAFAHYRW